MTARDLLPAIVLTIGTLVAIATIAGFLAGVGQ